MAVITTGNHPKALWPGIARWWGTSYNEFPKEYTDLVDVMKSNKAYEEDVETSGFGLAPVKAQGAATSYDEDLQGFTKRYTHVAYSLGYIVTREERADNLYTEVSKRRSRNLAFSMSQTKENVVANIYNRAFNSSYTGGDSKELLATDHPTRSGTFSNELTTAADISETSLEDMVIQIMGATNSRGLKIALMPKTLIVPRQLIFEAERILKSTQQSGTANNDVNALRSLGSIPGGVKVNHYLTDPDAWFIRTNLPTAGLTLFQRDAIEFTQDNDFDTDNAKAKSYERYSVGWTDPRTLYGSAGA